MISLIRSIGYQYDRWFRKSPLLTLAIANGICSALGDSTAQLITIWSSDQAQHFELNYPRLLRYLLYGLNMGPISGKWNEFLERQFPPPSRTSNSDSKTWPEISTSPIELIVVNPNGSSDVSKHSRSHSGTSIPSVLDPTERSLNLTTIFKMVLTDQLVMAPFSLIYFICFMGFTEGETWDSIYSRIHRLFIKLLFANWKIWPIIQLVNFKFMPLRLRVPFGAACGIIWTIFLSYASA